MKRGVSLRYLLWMVCWSLASCGGGGGTRAKVDAMPMPAHGSFTGVWFSPQYGRMDMMQQGRSVVGKYEKDERTGKIQGKVTGNLMRFRWEETREMIPGRPTTTSGRGYFRYVVDGKDQDHKLVGEWGHDQDEVGGGPWNAVKSRKLRPEIPFSPSSGGQSEGSGQTTERTDPSSSPSRVTPSPTPSTSPSNGSTDDLGPL
jgi:hypothetical protein